MQKVYQRSGRKAAMLGGAVATVLGGMLATRAQAGVVHQYSFATDATDSVGGATGTLINGATVSAGALQSAGGGSGAAATAPGMTLPAAAVTGLTGAFSIESFYNRATTSTNNYATLFAFAAGNTDTNNYLAATAGRGGGQDVQSVAFKQAGVNAGAEVLLVGPVTTPNSSHYMVTTYDGAGNARLYSDGVAVATSNLLAGYNLSTKGVKAGIAANAPFGDQGFYGSTSEFRINDNAITALDVATNYLRGPDNASVTTLTSTGSGDFNSAFSSPPTSNNIAAIAAGHAVTLNSGSGAAGILKVANGGSLSIGGGSLTVGSIVDLDDGSAVNLNAGGTLALRGLTVSGDLTAVGGSRQLNLNGGTLNVTALPGVSTRLGQGATLAPLSGTTVNWSADTTIAADGALYLGGNHAGAGALNKTGLGDFGLAGDATNYTGTINVNQGSVSIVPTVARTGATAFANAINLDPNNTGNNVNINFGQTVPLTVASTITIGSGGATYGINSFGVPNQNAILTGKITGGSGAGIVSMTGFFRITSTTNDYVGTTYVNGGTSVAIASPTAFGNPATNLFIWNNGGIEGVAGSPLTGANKVMYESLISPNLGAFFNGNEDMEYGGNITSSSAGGSVGVNEIQKNGLGKLILSGTVTLGGRIGVNGGGGTIARPRILQFNGNQTNTSAAIGNAFLYIDQGGNNDTEYVELTGGATVTNFSLWGKGRSTNETLAGGTVADRRTSGLVLNNLSGDNTWTGGLAIRSGGGGFSVRSEAGTLTIGGNVYNNVGASNRGYELTGAGTGKFTGTITDVGGPAPAAAATTNLFITMIGETTGAATTGNGSWSLEGTTGNTFSGGLTVINGTFNVNGATTATSTALSNRVAAYGGTLGGTGSVSQTVTVYGTNTPISAIPVEGVLSGGVQVANVLPGTTAETLGKGGTLNPGNATTPISTFTIGGALDLRAGAAATDARGKVQIDLNASSFDKVNVTGDGKLSNGTLVLNRIGGVTLTGATDREILHIGGTITGPFATVGGVLQSATSALAVTYTDHSVNIRVARPGDANLSGTVGFEDLVTLAQNYNKLTGQSWVKADFDGDGGVAFADLVLLAQNYNQSGLVDTSSFNASFASDWALAQSLVPEPTSLAALAGVATIALRRRR